MKILVIAEHHTAGVTPATLSTITAATHIGAPVHLLLVGDAVQPHVTQLAKIQGITALLWVEAMHYSPLLAAEAAALIVPLVREHGYTHIMMPATSTGKEVMPTIAALLDVQQVSEITAVLSADTFVRPIYAGNAYAQIRSTQPIHCITVRASAFEKAHYSEEQAEIIALPALAAIGKVQMVEMQQSGGERPELTSARIVVSGGRGVGSADNFHLIEQLADRLGAAIGASRAAVDAGYVPNDYQVGQTGKIVAPDLYIAVGISGAIQHIAGMKESKTIIAINKDENAPIFAVADVGLVGDLFQVVPELIAKLYSAS
jgi:electron transfer flavoprotein alpha subunit